MIVRDERGVDRRQLGDAHWGCDDACGANSPERRCALGEDRVEQNVEAAQLKQKTGMSDPGQAAFIRSRARKGNRVRGYWEAARGWRPRHAGSQPLPLPTKECRAAVIELGIRPGIHELRTVSAHSES
jgi:hypothetical protein